MPHLLLCSVVCMSVTQGELPEGFVFHSFWLVKHVNMTKSKDRDRKPLEVLYGRGFC